MSNIKIALTVMVRDEADIISQMLEHHIAQGVEVILVCDNGSTDGTFDILSQYKKEGSSSTYLLTPTTTNSNQQLSQILHALPPHNMVRIGSLTPMQMNFG